MDKNIFDAIIVLDFIVLIIMIASLRFWQKKRGRISEKSFALILAGYWSLFSISISYPLYSVNLKVALVVNIVLLLGFWVIGYPFNRWLYRQFTSHNK